MTHAASDRTVEQIFVEHLEVMLVYDLVEQELGLA